MGYWETIKWNEIKKDIEKGIKKGLVAVKDSALIAKDRAGELTDEGRRRYRILELKAKAHKNMHDLGSRVYRVMTSRSSTGNPAADAEVKSIVAQIRSIDIQIAALEALESGMSAREDAPAKAKTSRKTAKGRPSSR